MSTNIQPFQGPYKRPKKGDIFEFRIGHFKCPGRVVSTEAKAGPSMPGAILVYIFNPVDENWSMREREVLCVSNLLIPPVLCNAKPWTQKLFKTVDNQPFLENEILGQHCFESSHGRLYDEHSERMLRPISPVGQWGLGNHRTIDDDVSKALGIPLIE